MKKFTLGQNFPVQPPFEWYTFHYLAECPTLTPPAAAAGSLSTTEHYEGITVTLNCNSGYTSVGDSSSTCNSGSWSATLGSCEQGKLYWSSRKRNTVQTVRNLKQIKTRQQKTPLNPRLTEGPK